MRRSERVDVFGGGAFGTALAIALAGGGLNTRLWARNPETLIQKRRSASMPDIPVPETIGIFAQLSAYDAPVALVAVPTQHLLDFLRTGLPAEARVIVSCAKGIHRETGLTPTELIRRERPDVSVAQLTGPSFAVDIAAGLPTALTLACADETLGQELQNLLTTPTLRLYRTDDVIGAELGGALKNVIAIGAGAVAEAGLGDSARAALIARGFAEMSRYALACGARSETLTGLSGLGDLVLTCSSEESRNFRFGRMLARGESLPAGMTVEGLHTARQLAASVEETPIADTISALADGELDIDGALHHLLNRPLRQE